ncbi:MAG: type II secretion system protein GspM [Pseudomonadota bacterium]
MRAWWIEMAPRERFLIVVASLLTIIIVGWQFILVPSLTARDEAQVRLDTADRTLSRIQESYILKRAQGAAAPSNARPTSGNIDDFKAGVTAAASDMGLAIARLQGNDANSVRLIFENVDPRMVFVWLEDVQTSYSGQVTRFNMEQAGKGLVRVNVDLAPGGS